jgi:hypothetical protein
MPPCTAVDEVAASVSIPPSRIPMQGVQPIAKIAPRPNEANHPVRLPTIQPPSRSTREGPPAGASAIVPVMPATAPDAPASSGRQTRSRPGIVMMPARLRPRTMSTTPPSWRSSGM